MKLETITDRELERTKQVLDDHMPNPLTPESAIEAGLFCIASQATPWEQASKIIYNLRAISRPNDRDAREKVATFETLKDPKNINEAATRAGWRFASAGRFNEFTDYFGSKRGEWLPEIIEADEDAREKYCRDIKWLNRKTFSFWQICVGGTNLIALDVYVMRGLSRMGVEMNNDYFTPKNRSVGTQRVRKTPGREDYLRIEQSAREVFSPDERFLRKDGKANGALIDGYLWWGGAARTNQEQLCLFGETESSLILPYANRNVA